MFLWYEECWLVKELKDIALCIPWGGTRTLPKAALLFPGCPSPVLASPLSWISKSAPWNPGKVMEAEVCFLQETGDRKASVPRSPTWSSSVSCVCNWHYELPKISVLINLHSCVDFMFRSRYPPRQLFWGFFWFFGLFGGFFPMKKLVLQENKEAALEPTQKRFCFLSYQESSCVSWE